MRHPRPNSLVLAALVTAIAMTAAGCGSSSEETTGASESTGAPIGVRARSCEGADSPGGVRVTGVSCALGRSLVAGWYKNGECSAPGGASRTSCRLGEFICLGAVTDRGVAVTCAAPGRSVAFVGRKPS